MGRTKLERFAENSTFENFFQFPFEEISEQDAPIKGKWHSDFFKNNNPIVLELGCGRGEYSIALAEKYPEKNFIGIDRKGARMWKGCKYSVENELKNVAFIRTQIQFINHFFEQNEVDEIWITFPDPQPKRSKKDKRLTSPLYIDLYQQILSPKGTIHLKTDNSVLFEYTLEVIEKIEHNLLESHTDIYNSKIEIEDLYIQTYYEKIWLSQGSPIHYLKFCLN